MLRAAAKNHRHVLPLCDPSLYGSFMEEMSQGEISQTFRLRAAVEVFRRTSAYDVAIAGFLGAHVPGGSTDLPEQLNLRLSRIQTLRYGENPQQTAALYQASSRKREELFEQIHGKELSYNNLLDLDSAWKLSSAFDDPAAAMIKHTNPCGVGRGASVDEALRRAIDADPVSAFGGILAVNRELDERAASLVEAIFLEVIVAPSFSQRALEVLRRKKNLRLIAAPPLNVPFEIRSAAGGYLIQSPDSFGDSAVWRVVTGKQPTDEDLAAMQFAWQVCAHVKSNSIVLTRINQTVGIGAGQMSRVDAARLAVMKSILPTTGAVAASDAFFPFRDGLDVLADAGVTAVIQPGGSVRDEEVVAAAEERGLSMIFTGERHFRH